MKDEINKFLNAGLLELYVLGFTSPQETQEIEDFIKKYAEVRKIYNQLKTGVDNYMTRDLNLKPEQISPKKKKQ